MIWSIAFEAHLDGHAPVFEAYLGWDEVLIRGEEHTLRDCSASLLFDGVYVPEGHVNVDRREAGRAQKGPAHLRVFQERESRALLG